MPKERKLNIKVTIKQIGSRKKGITERDFFLEAFNSEIH